jgi:hypothetical protein
VAFVDALVEGRGGRLPLAVDPSRQGRQPFEPRKE